MMQFKYKNENSVETGIINILSASLPVEADIEANGFSFHIIAGNHEYGNYICIPNWNIGSELADFGDTFWNSERLANYTGLNQLNASIIAAALAEINNVI